MKKNYWPMIPLFIMMVLVVFFWRGLSLHPNELPSTRIGHALPWFELPKLGDSSSKATPLDMKGHVVLLNVWASWCSACVDEQWFLLTLAQQGVLIYGLNYKDNDKAARHWLKKWGNPYRMVFADTTGRVAMDLGVYGAPETFLVDKTGVIRYRHVGSMTPDVWEKELLPRMVRLEKTS